MLVTQLGHATADDGSISISYKEKTELFALERLMTVVIGSIGLGKPTLNTQLNVWSEF